MPEVIAALVGTILLAAFYSVAQARWPESYYSVEDIASYRISTHPLRYGLFRFGPVFLASLLVAATLESAGRSPSLGAILLIVLHLASSLGRGMLSLLLKRRAFARIPQILLHLSVGCGVVVSGAAGAVVGVTRPIQSTIPPVQVIVQSLWTAVIAAVLGAFLVKASMGRSMSRDELLNNARRKLNKELLQLGVHEAEASGTDPTLVTAIMLVESLQRPGWVRRIERWKGRLVPAGTYGVMQVFSPRPISDEESIQRAIATQLRGVQVPKEDYGADYDELAKILAAYNPNPTFVELASDFYLRMDIERDGEE